MPDTCVSNTFYLMLSYLFTSLSSFLICSCQDLIPAVYKNIIRFHFLRISQSKNHHRKVAYLPNLDKSPLYPYLFMMFVAFSFPRQSWILDLYLSQENYSIIFVEWILLEFYNNQMVYLFFIYSLLYLFRLYFSSLDKLLCSRDEISSSNWFAHRVISQFI